MKFLTLILRRLLALFWGLFAWTTILLAVVLTGLRLLLPLAAQYQTEIAQAASDAIGQPIRVAALKPQWHGFGPMIVFHDMELLAEEGGRPLLRFDEARIGIDVLKSLLHQRIEHSHLTVVGVDITLVRKDDGGLGVEGFGAMGADAGQQGNRQFIEQWLASQSRMRILDSNIYWRDGAHPGERLRFSHVDLELRNEGRHHMLSGSAVLPHKLGHKLDMALAFTGPLLDAQQWRGEVYVNGSGCNLPRMLARRDFGTIAVRDGLADARAWGHFEAGRLQSLEGNVEAHGLLLENTDQAGHGEPDGALLHYRGGAGRFHWRSHDHGWVLDADKFWLARGKEVTPQAQFRVFSQQVNGTREIETRFSHLGVRDAVDWVRLSGRAVPALGEVFDAGLEGVLRQVYVHVERRPGAHPEPYFYTRFVDLGIEKPWRGIPAVTGLDGVLRGSPDSGLVEFDSQAVRVSASESMFRRAIAIDRIRGDVAWHRGDSGWRIESSDVSMHNPDIRARARFTVAGKEGQPRPSVDVVAEFGQGDIAHVSRYLPASKVPPRALQWLDRALVNGRISSGALVLRGNLSRFPFDDGSGVFEARFNVEGGILEYGRDWPRIEELEAGVNFKNRRLRIDATHGKILNATIERAQARIDDLFTKPAFLSVEGRVNGGTRDGLRFVTGSPLRDKIGAALRDAAAQGRSRLSLSLGIPLSGAPKEVKGTMTFEDSALAFGSGIEITRINGALSFTHEGLQARDIEAHLAGYPAVIDAGTLASDSERITYFEARGRTDVDHVKSLKFMDLPFIEHVEGRTAWNARLRLMRSADDRRMHSRLQIESDLQGVSASLPAPLAKTAQEEVPLLVEIEDLGARSLPVYFRYGDRLNGALLAADTGSGRVLERAEFRFSGDRARLPEHEGIRIAGQLERFDWEDWRQYATSASGEAKGDGMLQRLADIDVEVKTLRARDWEFTDIALHALRREESWLVRVKCKEMAGVFTLPDDRRRPVMMAMNYMHIDTKTMEGKAGDTNPVDFPPLQVASEKITYNGKNLGALKLVTVKQPAGLRVERLDLSSDFMALSLTGEWLKGPEGHESSFAVDIDSDNVGKSLSSLGYVDTIKSGAGKTHLQASWRGSPTAIDWRTLKGEMSLNIDDGRLLDVEPGAGRILGILSLQTLPRRLTLDFSDLFKKGFSFDEIKGDFSIRDGNAYTENLFMEGPSASVEVSGRVGLADRDYDQKVTVTPHLTGSLPIAGAIATGVSLGIGAAILLVQKLLEDPIDRMAQVQYTVTGSWEEPIVERLAKDKGEGSTDQNS